MSPHRTRRIDRDTAEALLAGVPEARRGTGRLGKQLAAAAAPGHPHELAGRAAALAAFRAARLQPAPELRRTSVIKTAVAKLLTVKAAALLGVVAAGGVALAATTGTLPHSLAGIPGGAPKSAHASANPTPSHPGRPSAMPTQALVGLCHAYLAGAGSDHGKALSSPAFTSLIDAAGGRDKVDAFCTKLVATSPGNPSGKPSAHPTGAGEEHATTGESHEPTSTPTVTETHPSGPPSRAAH